MSKKVLKRNEVNELHTWDLKRLYKEESLYEKDVEKLERLVEQFSKEFFGNLNTANSIVKALDMYQEILKLFTYTSTYQSLHSSVDRTDNQNLERSGKYGIISNELSSKLTLDRKSTRL